jgi:transcriptional regulator with XRE-family HTH domain
MQLVNLARPLVGYTHRQLADVVGYSERTVRRWYAGGSNPDFVALGRLADAVRPKDSSLAAELDAAAGRPPPAPLPLPPVVVAPPPAAPAVPPHVLVDSIVCAAAEAMSLTPQAVRPAIVAAFKRASEAAISPHAVYAVLAPTEGSRE